jgi:inner membrane protein
MDLFTHALLGANLARATTPDHSRLKTRERLLFGATAAAFPDIDFVGFLINPLVFLADWHQGPTHSLVLLPLWAVLIAALFAGVTRKRAAFGEAVAISALGLASHIAADLITVYGTMVLYPLSRWRPSLGTTFVIDPAFTVIVLAGLGASLWSRRRWMASVSLIVLALYIGSQAWLQQLALDIGRVSVQKKGLEGVEVSALPQPFSPFNWKIIASNEAMHYQAYVNLMGHAPLVPPLTGLHQLHAIAASYRPPARVQLQIRHRYGEQQEHRAMVEQLWTDPRLAPFRRFASHPALSDIDYENRDICIWFTDLRYDLPVLPDTFRYGFCRADAEQPWELYRLRYFSERSRQRIEP